MNQSQCVKITEEQLHQFSDDVESLWSNKPIQTLENVPTPIHFLREYVNLSTPVIIKNVFPTITLDELIAASANQHDDNDDDLRLNVDVTPDGHGDTIRIVDGKKMFVMPEVRNMSITEFRDKLRSNKNWEIEAEKDENGLIILSSTKNAKSQNDVKTNVNANDVVYYSRQNDCLRQELKPLTSHFPPHIDFASEAFSSKPDAINLWIGNEKSVSSLHKDHYENIFCVASGVKSFTICPPADSIFLKEGSFPSGVFYRDDDSGGWSVNIQSNDDGETEKVHWIESDIERLIDMDSVDSRLDYIEKYPSLKFIHPKKVILEAGDMFYLPALWYHRVTQLCETVAVNYWYDMRFDSPNWCYFNFLQNLNCKATIEDDKQSNDAI